MRFHNELLEASGYSGCPKDFEELLRILDNEVRLITPTDPEGKAGADESPSQASPGQKYYQLTHDYLVPSLRDWLTRKQNETRRGRAEIRLAERAAFWTAKPGSRHLPAWWEWLNIRLLTRKQNWTSSQRKMMRQATRYHAVRGLVLAGMLVVATLAGLSIRGQVIEQHNGTHAAGLVSQLLDAEIAQVPGIIKEMQAYRQWTDPLLMDAYAEAKAHNNSRKQLHASLALLPDRSQVEYLYGRLLDAEPQEVVVIRDALLPHKDQFVDRLWIIVEQPPKAHEEERLRAACALAIYDPDNARWAKVSGLVVEQLVAINPVFLGLWLGDPCQSEQGFRPVKDKLLDALTTVFNNRDEGQASARSLATSILADYAADQPDRLVDLVQDADERQFAILYPTLDAYRKRAVTLMGETLTTALESKKTEEDKEKLAKRQANAAVTLLRMGQADRVWPLLKHPSHPQPQAYGFSDPRVRSYLIHRLSPLGVKPDAIVRRLDEENELSIRRALLLILGEFGPEQFSLADRASLIPKVLQLYREDPDAGLHGAAEWLLRQWGQQEKLKVIEQDWAKVEQKQQRKERQETIRHELKRETGRGEGYWYENGQGQTMVVIPGQVDFLMGSPPTEFERRDVEVQHKQRIHRTFAIAAKPVTLEQFQKHYRAVYKATYDAKERYTPTDDCPVNYTSWYEAAAYCNWLSKEEGMDKDQWCYEVKGQVTKLRENYLSLEGYRLPTEAEWEYACRAGAATSRYYGETEELLPKYGWYLQNSKERTWPVGSKKPNDLGLFDMHGNVWCWCQESYKAYATPKDDEVIEDKEDVLDINPTTSRVLRGGSFFFQPSYVRSAYRDIYVPSLRIYTIGFRPARTFTP